MPERQEALSVGPFIGGLIVGLIVGGIVLPLPIFFVATALIEAVKVNANWLAFAIDYALVIALAAWAFVSVRRRLTFFTGFLVGSTVGLLGGTALCNVFATGLSDMH